MITEKYKEVFFNLPKNKPYKSIINRINLKEKEFNEPCINWSIEQVGIFLRDLKILSPNSLSKMFSVLKDFIEYVCKKENLTIPNLKFKYGEMDNFIDYETLMATTISSEEYEFIKSQLTLNVRDKVVFELAWYLLSNEDIKFLKESDIKINEENISLKVKDKNIIINDIELAGDIKNCIETKYYNIFAKDGRTKRMLFKKISEYLIKPVQVGRTSKESCVSNVSGVLLGAFVQQKVSCEGIDIESLAIESIRRSKMIYLVLFEEEGKLTNDSFIDSSYFFWLKKLAKVKYGEKDSSIKPIKNLPESIISLKTKTPSIGKEKIVKDTLPFQSIVVKEKHIDNPVGFKETNEIKEILNKQKYVIVSNSFIAIEVKDMKSFYDYQICNHKKILNTFDFIILLGSLIEGYIKDEDYLHEYIKLLDRTKREHYKLIGKCCRCEKQTFNNTVYCEEHLMEQRRINDEYRASHPKNSDTN